MTHSTPSPAADLPCPFCASKVSQIRLQGWPQRECLQCGALGPKQSHATPEWNWNVRAATLTAPDTATPAMRRLIIAARNVAFKSQPDNKSLHELDEASEAFAEAVPWDDEPAPPTEG